MKLYIPAASGIEAAVKREIWRLGYGNAPAVRGRVELEGDWADIARLNVNLRAGERVLLGLAEFRAETFDELFDGIRSIAWEEYFTAHTKILIDGKSVKSKLGAIKAAGGVVKKAIVTRLKEKLHARTLDEAGERAVVGISIYENLATVTLDTSGEGLHKRGYRVLTYDAPLRETTAAAIIEDSFYRADKAFADPFCGSGTIPIEAVLYARNIAPGKARNFDFTRWKCAPEVLADARAEAKAAENHGEIAPVYASDISPRAISASKQHAERAGVLKDIVFAVSDMRDFTAGERYGVLVSNPPYGERLESTTDLFPLYKDLRQTVRRLPDWSAYILSGYEGAERALGRPDKRRLLYNADIKCSLLSYFGKPPKK